MLTWKLTRGLQAREGTPENTDTAFMDEVVLADGQVLAVPHANLAAAKALLAARKAAAHRVSGTHGHSGSVTRHAHRSDTTGWDSGVLPVAQRSDQAVPWLRAEEPRDEKVS